MKTSIGTLIFPSSYLEYVVCLMLRYAATSFCVLSLSSRKFRMFSNFIIPSSYLKAGVRIQPEASYCSQYPVNNNQISFVFLDYYIKVLTRLLKYSRTTTIIDKNMKNVREMRQHKN